MTTLAKGLHVNPDFKKAIIGGFIGTAEYEGPVAEFLPILRAARWTGVGRHCVWGNGEIVTVTK